MKRLLLLAAVLALGTSTACRRSDPVAPRVEPDTTGKTEVTFTYAPPPGSPSISSITVPGSFNNWSTSALAMQRQMDGSWKASLRLEEGTYQYKYFINGAWPPDMCSDATWGDPSSDLWIDPAADECVDDNNGGRNAVIHVGTTGTDTAFVVRHASGSAADVSAAGGRISIRMRASAQRVRSAAVRVGGQAYPMHVQMTTRRQDVWRATVPEGTTQYTIELERTDGGTQQIGPQTVPASLFRAVPWVGGSVGYQIFPERFWNGDPSNDSLGPRTDDYHFMHPNFRGTAPSLTSSWNGPMLDTHCCHQYFGGDLQGIIDRLDHLQSLGVTFIYLNPIFSSGSAHGYDTFDYMAVEPSFGDERVLRALVDAAHARGMKLMWDFVPNHVGVGHGAFQDAVQRGTASPYWPWFTFKVPQSQIQVGNGAHYESWWGIGSLPKLNTTNADVMTHLMGVVRKWTEFGFDGIRVDVPGEIVNRSQFFGNFRQTAKTINPDVYLVGEVWQRSPDWLQGNQFDALMNYAIGQDVIERYVNGAISGGAALASMAQLYADYPEAAVAMLFNLISSHDTARLLTKLGGGRLGQTASADALARQRLASAMLYALPGVPITFQGDECAFLGMNGGRDEHRYPMQWQSCDQTMTAHYATLARLKRETAALASPAIRLHTADASIVSFLRGEPGVGEVLAVFNNATTGKPFTLPTGTWADALDGQQVSGSVNVGPMGWRYLVRR